MRACEEMATFQFSETSAFTPVTYDTYDIANISPAFAEVSSNLCNVETRQLQQTFVDQWLATMQQPSYHDYTNMLAYPYLHECLGEPGFIRKRNERERMRVRNVNDGYARLRDHLPLEPTEKRLSKVETLRGAINYIKFLQSLLDDSKGDCSTSCSSASVESSSSELLHSQASARSSSKDEQTDKIDSASCSSEDS